MSDYLVPAALTCCFVKYLSLNKYVRFIPECDDLNVIQIVLWQHPNLPSACQRLYCTLHILFCSILLLTSVTLIIVVPLLACNFISDVMTPDFPLHEESCCAQYYNAATQGIAPNATVCMWFRFYSGTKLPTVYHRLYCNLRVLFCSILLLPPAASYATACFLMQFCYFSDDRHSDCPGLLFMSNAAWGVLLCPLRYGSQSGFSAPLCHRLGTSRPFIVDAQGNCAFRCWRTGQLCFANRFQQAQVRSLPFQDQAMLYICPDYSYHTTWCNHKWDSLQV